jgi:SOS-response transcriptional repressor LexA
MRKPRQQTILHVIHQYYAAHGFPPSLREIGRGAGISSTSVVTYHIERLVTLGYLIKSPGKSRAFALTGRAFELLGEENSEDGRQKLWEEIRRLKAENERLCREHQTQLNALRRDYRYLVKELKQLRQTREHYPA